MQQSVEIMDFWIALGNKNILKDEPLGWYTKPSSSLKMFECGAKALHILLSAPKEIWVQSKQAE